MTTLAFLHVGPETRLPTLFVASVRRHNPDIRIIQVTDADSPGIPGVDLVGRRRATHANLVQFRVEGFAAVPIEHDTWFFDTDMLCHRPLAYRGPEEVAVCHRQQRVDHLFNPDAIVGDWSEFNGRTMGSVFPYVACATLVRTPEFWPTVTDTLLALPSKFHNWYGDQEAIRLVVESGRFGVGRLPEALYGCLPEYEASEAPYLTHYKGKRKALMFERAERDGLGSFP